MQIIILQKQVFCTVYYLKAYYNGQLFKEFKNNQEAANYFNVPKNTISSSYKTKYHKIVNKYTLTFPNVSTIESITS